MPVLSPYIPINKEIHMSKSEFMKEILIRSKEITDKYEIELGPLCDSCKHNTINFK